MSEKLRSCKLCKGNATQISWVNESEAERGNVLCLDDPETGDPGWVVAFVYQTQFDAQDVEDKSRAYLPS